MYFSQYFAVQEKKTEWALEGKVKLETNVRIVGECTCVLARQCFSSL